MTGGVRKARGRRKAESKAPKTAEPEPKLSEEEEVVEVPPRSVKRESKSQRKAEKNSKDGPSTAKNDEEEEPPEKKKGRSKIPTNPDERTPQQAARAAQIHAFFKRPKPAKKGLVPVPVGAPNYLAGMTFVRTGVLDGFDEEDIKGIVARYGGTFKTRVTKDTTHVIVGLDPGATKINKAEELLTPQITETEFLDIIRRSNPDANPIVEPKGEESGEKQENEDDDKWDDDDASDYSEEKQQADEGEDGEKSEEKQEAEDEFDEDEEDMTQEGEGKENIVDE